MKSAKPTKRAKPTPKPRGIEVVLGHDNTSYCVQVFNHDSPPPPGYLQNCFLVRRVGGQMRLDSQSINSIAEHVAHVLGVKVTRRDTRDIDKGFEAKCCCRCCRHRCPCCESR